MNPFKVGDIVRVRGGKNFQIYLVEGTVTRILGEEVVEVDLGPDPLYVGKTPGKDPGTVKINLKVGLLEKV